MNKKYAFIESLGAVINGDGIIKPGTGGFPELAGLTASTIINIRTDDGGNGYSRLWVTLKGASTKED